jgi:hypothetical protein
MRRKILAVAAASLTGLAAVFFFGPARHLPSFGSRPAQVALFDLGRLQKEFDAEVGRTRVIALLSPT